MQSLPQAFAGMGAYAQFICYVLIPSKLKPGKMDKLPVSPITGAVINAHDKAHHTDALTACASATAFGPQYGVAFVFTADDPFFFIDLDNQLDPATGEWSPFAQQVCQAFAGAAVELSQSGTGLHLFGRGAIPEHACKNAQYRCEFYHADRFVAMTGNGAVGNVDTDHTAALAWLACALFPPGAGGSGVGGFELTVGPVSEWNGPTDDADLIRRALNSRSAASTFGQRATFADLWLCDTERLRVAYPDPDRLYDASAADAALVSHLAFWTGRDGARIARLMRMSKLVREKWDRHGDDYLARTINEVLALGGDVLRDKEPEAPSLPMPAAGAASQRAVVGSTFMSGEDQAKLFGGCVYVQDRHKVLVPGGHLLKPDQFRVAFGGYTFALDDANQRTTRNAWEAFTESQILRAPIADTICFKPSTAPGSISDVAGRTYANIWWPAKVPRSVGDVTPFLRHLELILPNARDREILLAYMAACVQYQGHKFQWCPVLQGTEGNGKTLFSMCVAQAIGQHYTHWPHAADLASDFNGWLSNKVFVAVEELYSHDHQTEVIEKMKTIITGEMGIQIQFKGVDQVSMEICCNLMATTNYKTAVRKTPDNARRFAIFFTPQQTAADIARSGMGGEYFPKLYDWLKKHDGFAIVSELLHTYPIPHEFDPLHSMHRAPDTSTTDQAVSESRGGIEQNILEAIDQGLPGFMGGWVSSVQLDRLLEELHMSAKIPHQRRRQMLVDLGYKLHPGLTGGRVNNPVQPDGRKPLLFIKVGSGLEFIQGPAEIAKAYSMAQQFTLSRA